MPWPTSQNRRFGKFRIQEEKIKGNVAGEEVKSEPRNQTSVRFRSGGNGKGTTIGVNYTVAKWQKANEIVPGVGPISQGCTTLWFVGWNVRYPTIQIYIRLPPHILSLIPMARPCQIQREEGKLRLPGVDGPNRTFLKSWYDALRCQYLRHVQISFPVIEILIGNLKFSSVQEISP